jgi:hypothetical protein
MSEARYQKLVDRAFVRGLPARQRRRLREHLATCEACRERWDRLAVIERRLGGPRLGDAVIEDIHDAVVPPATRAGPRRAWWAAAAALGAAASVAVVLLVLRPAPPLEPTLTPRGGGAGAARAPGVRLFCVAGDGDHVRAETRMVSTGPVPELRCSIDDDLQLAYSTPDREGLTMVAFARMDTSILRYAPPPHDRGAMALAPDRVDELVGWSTRLRAAHRPGTHDVVVRFFDREVPAHDAVAGAIPPLVELRARLELVARGALDDAR